MKKRFIIIYIALSIILFKLIFNYVVNERFIFNYNNGNYNKKDIDSLFIFNISEPYIVHYNYANILYNNNQYNKAIEEYKKSLNLFVPKKRVCNVRINLSLAIIADISLNNLDSDETYKILNKLKEAKAVLYQDGCANTENDNGKSQEAETLENEIKKIEKELSGNTDEDNNNSNKESNSNNNKEQDNLEKELKDIQKQTWAERKEKAEQSESYNSNNSYSGKIW